MPPPALRVGSRDWIGRIYSWSHGYTAAGLAGYAGVFRRGGCDTRVLCTWTLQKGSRTVSVHIRIYSDTEYAHCKHPGGRIASCRSVQDAIRAKGPRARIRVGGCGVPPSGRRADAERLPSPLPAPPRQRSALGIIGRPTCTPLNPVGRPLDPPDAVCRQAVYRIRRVRFTACTP